MKPDFALAPDAISTIPTHWPAASRLHMPIPLNSEPEKPDLHPLFVLNVPAKDINIFDMRY